MTDPAPFLSTVVTASAGLVAIVGGLLVARFVSLDSEQRGSRKVLTDARERLESAWRRAREAHTDLLDWHAKYFFRGAVLAAVGDGTSDPAALMQLGDWPFTRDDLKPFAEELAKEFADAREQLAGRGDAIDGFSGLDAWEQFRRATPDLPEIRWARAWEHVFEQIQLQRYEAQKAARQRYGLSGAAALADLDNPGFLRAPALLADRTDYRAIAARREDELEAAEARAQQRAEDSEAEVRRLEQAHQEIVRPDAWLWWGVIVLTAFAAAGVALPMWVMSEGPDDLARVGWLVWPFLAGLAVLIGYIVMYLVHLIRAGRNDRSDGNS